MTFVKKLDESIIQLGIDDSTVANSTTFADLVALSDPISFIETTNVADDTNDNNQSIVCKIPKMIVGGTLNITAPRTVSNFYMIVNGGKEFQTNELANYGNMTFQGYVKDNQGLNQSAYNLTLELARLSASFFNLAEGALELSGTSNFSDMIIRNGNPVDAFTDQEGIVNLTRVWLQPIDRSFALTGDNANNAYWRYRQTGTFEDVIISSPITFFRFPPAIIRPTILSLGGFLIMGFNGIDRFAVNGDPVNIDGLAIIGDGSVQSLGSPRIYLKNSEKGTDTPISSTGFTVEKQAGVHFDQDVQFEIRNTSGELLENVVIRDQETDNGHQLSSLSYCTQRTPAIYTLYDDTTTTNRINVYTSDSTGITNIVTRRQGIVCWNYSENSNYNDQIAEGQFLDLKTIDTDNNVQFGAYAIGYKIDFQPIQIRERDATKLIKAIAIPVPEYQHSEAEIRAFTEYETYTKLFEGIKLWEKDNDEIVNYIDVGESLIDFNGSTLNIRSGWSLKLEATTGNISIDNITQQIIVPVGSNGFSSDDTFTKLYLDSNFEKGDIEIRGFYEYTNGQTRTSHNIMPISTLAEDTPFSVDVLNSNDNTVIENYHDIMGALDTYLELDDDQQIILHVYGTGVLDKEIPYIDVPDVLNFDIENDPTINLEEEWSSKNWNVVITDNTISFGGTDTLENINAGAIRFLLNRAVTRYNQLNPTNRYNVDDYVIYNASTLTFLKQVLNFNSLFITSGATRLILHDSNNANLVTNYGISTSTTNNFSCTVRNLQLDDIIGYEIDGVIQPLIIKSDDIDVIIIFEKANENIMKVKRNRYDSVEKTITENDSIYQAQFGLINGLSIEGVMNERILNDYVETTDKILLKQDFPETTDSVLENEKDYAFWAALDLTFPFGVTAKHIINSIDENVCVLNYDLDTFDKTKTTTYESFYNNAGVSNGTKNTDGSTHYQEYTIQNVGRNFESFEIHLHNTTGSYNPAGAIFHNIFSTTGPGNIQNFYLVKANGTRREISAFVNSKQRTTWQMNRGLPDTDLANGEHITFLKPSTDVEYNIRKQIRIGAPVIINNNGTLTNITPNITWLPQKQIAVNIPIEVTENLSKISGIETIVSDNNALNQDIIEDIGENKYQTRNVYNIVTRHDNASTRSVINNLEIDVSSTFPTKITRRFMAVINIPEDAQDVTYIARIQKATNDVTVGTGNVYMRMRPITSTFDPDTNYSNNITVGDIIREADTYDVERLPKVKDDIYQLEGKFSVIGLTGWHVVGIELDVVGGNTTANLESFGINANIHPDATGGIFYTTNNGTNSYAQGNPYEIKLTYSTDLSTVNNKIDNLEVDLKPVTDKLDTIELSITNISTTDLSTIADTLAEIKLDISNIGSSDTSAIIQQLDEIETKIDNIEDVDLTVILDGLDELKTDIGNVTFDQSLTDKIDSIKETVEYVHKVAIADYDIQGKEFQLKESGSNTPFLKFEGIQIMGADPSLFNGGRKQIGN